MYIPKAIAEILVALFILLFALVSVAFTLSMPFVVWHFVEKFW